MEIPHKLEIKPGVFYYIAFVSKFDDPNQLGNCADGQETVGGRTILIHKEISPAEQYEIFCHEVLHALEFEYKIKLPHKLIYELQGPLAFLLLNNPGIIPKLKTKSKKATAKKKKV